MLPPTQCKEFVAAVDLGSNSFHMIVIKLVDGQVHVVDRLKEMVRLAAGLNKDGTLAPEAEERALACLERFGQRLRNIPVGCVRAVGTNTLRRADNCGDFVNRAEAALGHPIEIISGREEARLVYLGVAHAHADDHGRRLVVDIGGGSTEIIVGEQFEPAHLESLSMGCVSVTQKFFPDGVITQERFKQAEVAARLEVRPYEVLFRHLQWQSTMGSSGTIRAIAAVAQSNKWSHGSITPEALKKIRQHLLDAGHSDKIRLEGLSDNRRPVFVGGVVVLSAIFDALKLQEMWPSDGALREGAIYDLLGRKRHEDVRGGTIDSMFKRYNLDPLQAERVGRVALGAFDQVGNAWGIADVENRAYLEWASKLHEIGLIISHNQYHKHGAYLLAYSDMAGFSQGEQRLLAFLVRNHRKKISMKSLKELPKTIQESALRLTILLRLGALLHRNRSMQRILPLMKFEAGKQSLAIRFDNNWLQEHPLTQADLERERLYLKAIGYELAFA